ncbi:hypothetical protein [Bacillus sp. NEB1478]|uniref:hypothetical protein n=1 Tax=Bacillus sp. NEB1478 TaxID=3073816 RepID=UPI002872AD88|nr:hypothetical protein [Bacillus sp. NEB1478]WNB93424.1 hypothetical protein RGB74_07070 [Bacillus sp. NEB1478]
MADMIEILRAVLVGIKNQLILAEETVEYTSWLTASIFSVLGVFTIFLSHQYQNHTSELTKLTWMMKNNVRKKDQDEFAQNIVDFEYYSKSPEVLLKAVVTSIIVLWGIVPIWFIAGLSKFFLILANKGTVHFLSLVLILIVTAIFIFFSIRLIKILSKLSETEEEGTRILTVTDLFNAKNLAEKNFDLTNLLNMNNTTWSFLITGEEPYTQIQITSEYGIHNYSLLLYIESLEYEIYLSTPIPTEHSSTLSNKVDMSLTEQQRVDIQRFFHNVNSSDMRVLQVIMVEGKLFCYNSRIEKQNDIYNVSMLEPKSCIDLPTEIENDIRGLKPFVDIVKN